MSTCISFDDDTNAGLYRPTKNNEVLGHGCSHTCILSSVTETGGTKSCDGVALVSEHVTFAAADNSITASETVTAGYAVDVCMTCTSMKNDVFTSAIATIEEESCEEQSISGGAWQEPLESIVVYETSTKPNEIIIEDFTYSDPGTCGFQSYKIVTLPCSISTDEASCLLSHGCKWETTDPDNPEAEFACTEDATVAPLVSLSEVTKGGTTTHTLSYDASKEQMISVILQVNSFRGLHILRMAMIQVFDCKAQALSLAAEGTEILLVQVDKPNVQYEVRALAQAHIVLAQPAVCGIVGFVILNDNEQEITAADPLYTRLNMATFDYEVLKIDSSAPASPTEPILFKIKVTLVDSQSITKSFQVKIGCFEVSSITAEFVPSSDAAISSDAPGHLFKITVTEKATIGLELLSVVKTKSDILACPDFVSLSLCKAEACEETMEAIGDFTMTPNPAVRDELGALDQQPKLVVIGNQIGVQSYTFKMTTENMLVTNTFKVQVETLESTAEVAAHLKPKNLAPEFEKDLIADFELTVGESTEMYEYVSPKAVDTEQDKIEMKFSGLEGLSAATVDHNSDDTFTLKIDQSKLTEGDAGTHTLKIEYKDDQGTDYLSKQISIVIKLGLESSGGSAAGSGEDGNAKDTANASAEDETSQAETANKEEEEKAAKETEKKALDSIVKSGNGMAQMMKPKVSANAISSEMMAKLKAQAEAAAKARMKEKKKEERVPIPIKLKIEHISRAGLVTVGFNQVLELPFFARNGTQNPLPQILQNKNKRRLEIENNTIALADINVPRDVLDFQYVFRQDEEPTNFTYGLQLTEWTPTYLKVQIDFSKPLMVSRGELEDEIVVVVMDKKLFMNPYGETIEQQGSIIMKPLPRQVPKGVDAEKLEEQAQDTGDAMKVFFIIQLIISFILKGSIDYLFSFFLTL